MVFYDNNDNRRTCCVLMFLLMATCCDAQLLFPPTITDVTQIDEHTIKIQWATVSQRNVKFTRYVMAYSTNNWASSNEWPAQMKLSHNCNELNRVFSEDYSIQSLNCLNFCLNKADCYGAYASNLNCLLIGNAQATTQQKPLSLDCYTLAEYSKEATIEYLPINEVYKFKVKVYDNESNAWTSFSSSSKPLDSRIHLIASVEKSKSDYALKLNWKASNGLKNLPIAGYKVSLSINGSPFEEIEEANTALSKFNKLISSQSTTNVLLDNFLHIKNSNQNHCKNECKMNHSCTAHIWSEIHKTCLLQMKLEPFQLKFSQASHYQNYIINKATEYIFQVNRQPAPLGLYVFKLEFTTIYGNTGMTFASIRLKNEQSTTIKTLIMIAIVFIHLVFVAFIAIILSIFIKRNFRSHSNSNRLANSEYDETSIVQPSLTIVDLPPDYYTIMNSNK